MAYSKFKMPGGFRGFPACPECGEKNFTRVKNQHAEGYIMCCDACGNLTLEENLVYPNPEPEENKTSESSNPLHRAIEDWNKPEMRRRVEEAVEQEKAAGHKVFRVRRPDQLD